MTDAAGAELVAVLLRRTRKAQRDLLRGDCSAYCELFEHSFDATLSGPFGGMYKGWLEIAPRLAAASTLFETTSDDSRIEVASSIVTDDVVVLVALETNVVRLKRRTQDLIWRLRATHVYRCDERGWHLLHRHADPLTERRSPDQTFAALI